MLSANKGLVAVEASDDISEWEYYDVRKRSLKGSVSDSKRTNKALAGSRIHANQDGAVDTLEGAGKREDMNIGILKRLPTV